MRPQLSKVNKRYDLKNGKQLLYFQIVVPDDRAVEIRQKLNNILDWFMSRNRIKGLNRVEYDMSPVGPTETTTIAPNASKWADKREQNANIMSKIKAKDAILKTALGSTMEGRNEK